MPETETAPESVWHIEPYDPDIDDPPDPDGDDCIGEHDGAEVPEFPEVLGMPEGGAGGGA
jgi:hypothetical protein